MLFCIDARPGVLLVPSGVCHGRSEHGAGSVMLGHISFVLLQYCLIPIWSYWGRLVNQLGKLSPASNWIHKEKRLKQQEVYIFPHNRKT